MFRLLLVVAAVCCAQTLSAVTSQHPRLLQALGDATNMLQAAQQSLEEASRTSPSQTLTSIGVVQDWSLVCKELCGAGLGVAPCANYCATSGDETAKFLGTVFDLAKCEQLHGLQSDLKCNSVKIAQKYGSRLCTSFCHQRNSTLSGCSPCQLLSVLNEVSTEQDVTTHGFGAGKSNQAKQLAASAMIKIKATKADTDQPNWSEMCKSLCKTGDGGSLCNCDLSPFSTELRYSAEGT